MNDGDRTSRASRSVAGSLAPMDQAEGPRWLGFAAACLAIAAVGENSTAIMAALPAMARAFGLDASGTEWLVNAYLLASASFIVLGGEGAGRMGAGPASAVGATLFALSATVKSLGDDLRADPVLRAKVDSIAERAKDATAALRESLAALSATPQELVLGVTLRADCRAFQDRSGIPARVILMDELPDVAVSRVEVLVAVVREALLNVEKHSQAKSVVITAFPVRDGLSVAVTDDGVGLDNASSDGLGLGLVASAARLQRVGGTLTLAENDDGGTTLRAWVPC